MRKEYVLWGTPKGSTDAIDEVVLYTLAKTPSELDRVKKMATEHGYHSFRVQILNLDTPPNFGLSTKG